MPKPLKNAPLLFGAEEWAKYARFLPKFDIPAYKPPTTFPEISRAKILALDLETYDPDLTTKGPGARRDGKIVGVAVHTDDGLVNEYFPVGHLDGPNCNPEHVFGWLKEQLGKFRGTILGANVGLYDGDYLQVNGVKAPHARWCDVQWAEPLLDEEADSYSLATLAVKYGVGVKGTEALVGKYGKDFIKHIQEVHPADAREYALGDVWLPFEIWKRQEPLLAKDGLTELFDLESRLTPLLLYMREVGVRVDLEGAARAEKLLAAKRDQALYAMNQMAGFAVDPDSWKSLAKACDKLGVSYPRTAPTAAHREGCPSFQAEWIKRQFSERELLEDFFEEGPWQSHEFFRQLLMARKYETARNPFLTNYILGSAINGRIHAEFHPLRGDTDETHRHGKRGTRAGRFSSTHPNLQNFPASDEIGLMMRGLIIPDEGMDFWAKDYSQIEYRYLIHNSLLNGCTGAKEAAEMYHKDPDTDFHLMVSELTGLQRKAAKTLNYGLCVAKGQRVLTDEGLIPIELVTTRMRVWDGEEWVAHDGVAYQGTRKIVEYDGLRATADHEVWLENGRKVPLWTAASSLDKPRLAVTGIEETPLRYPDDRVGKDSSGQKIRSSCLGVLLNLWKHLGIGCLQHSGGKDERLPYLLQDKVSRAAGKDTRGSLRHDGAALLKPFQSILQELWRAWDSEQISLSGGLHSLYFEGATPSYLQRSRHRQDRQRWPLRTWKSASSDTSCESSEQAQESDVYDIINAGPRHRFTVEGKLVSNCYGMGKFKLARTLGLALPNGDPSPEALAIMETYHTRCPFVRELSRLCMDAAQERGYIRTILGRRSRFNLWIPAAREMYNALPMPLNAAKEAYGEDLVRGQTYKALNRLLQGSAADLMKKAMVMIWESGMLGPGKPLTVALTVHDELDGSAEPGEAGEKSLAAVSEIMETAIPLRVPVLVGAGRGKSWAEAH